MEKLELVKIENGRIYYKSKDAIIINRLGGQAVRKQWNTYRIFLNVYSLRLFYSLLPKTEIRARDIIKKAYQKLALHINKLSEMKKLEDVEGDTRLRPYQRVDVKILKELGTTKLLLNEMRLGKSPTTLIALTEENVKTAILVCPASLLYQWQDEIRTWTHYIPIIIDGTKTKRIKIYKEMKEINCELPIIWIISYETLREDMKEVTEAEAEKTKKKAKKRIFPKINFDALVIDEAHRLRNHQSQQSKALYKLSNKCNYKYLLTGTPVINSADEIFGMLKMAFPTMYSSYWEFAHYYFNVMKGEYTDYEVLDIKRKKELQSVVYMLSIQRKRKDVMKWLPEKEYQRIYLEFDAKQKKHYDKMLNTFETEHVSAINTLSQLTRLKQITMNPAILDLDGASPKEQYILDFITNNVDASILIFSTSTKFLKELSKKLKVKHQMIIGRIAKNLRNVYKKQFQNGEIRVLLLNIKASQEGLTLDEADYAIFADRLYEYELNIQAEDRYIPISEDRVKPKTIIDLLHKNSVDERLYDEILVKKGNATKIINNIGLKEFLK
jgi:SNF2 family DNA or RNA helicase